MITAYPQVCRLDRRSNTLALYRYSGLHTDGQRLIKDWIRRGLEVDEGSVARFEEFIYLWIGFNAWAACVTDEDQDSRMIQRLAEDTHLNADFVRLLSEPRFASRVERFANLWPIFRAQEISRKGLSRWPEPTQTRADVVADYLHGGARRFAPRCFTFHHDQRHVVPQDWAHTITVAYAVRCNLFHGGKTRSSETDVEVVDATYGVLSTFIARAIVPLLH